MKRRCAVDCSWSPALAYVIGLWTTDGNLSSDGRHLSLVSKDAEMITRAKSLLGLSNVIGRTTRSNEKERKYYRIQFGDVNFYEFLLSLGLTPRKSKTLGPLKIPNSYFLPFLRGCIDGDGCITGFRHPESSLFQLRVSLASASPRFLRWVHNSITELIGTKGGWIRVQDRKGTYTLSYGKTDSILILRAIYRNKDEHFLKRKYRIAREYLGE